MGLGVEGGENPKLREKRSVFTKLHMQKGDTKTGIFSFLLAPVGIPIIYLVMPFPVFFHAETGIKMLCFSRYDCLGFVYGFDCIMRVVEASDKPIKGI